jgi:hypothetical protein
MPSGGIMEFDEKATDGGACEIEGFGINEIKDI